MLARPKSDVPLFVTLALLEMGCIYFASSWSAHLRAGGLFMPWKVCRLSHVVSILSTPSLTNKGRPVRSSHRRRCSLSRLFRSKTE